jgi:PAS domain S-box-containing protein
VWVEVRTYPSTDGVAIFFRDITARKEAEQKLQASEARFRQFAEHSTNVLWIVDIETSRLEYLSPAFENTWGEPPDAMLRDLGRWVETIHPDDRARALDAFDRVRRGEIVLQEYRIVRPDGAVRWIRDAFFPMPDEQGRLRRAGGIAQDITKHTGSLLYVVDADDASRQELTLLLQGAGYNVKAFASARAFLDVASVLAAGCVVLDVGRPEAGGLDLPRDLWARRIELPVIVIASRRGDVGFAVQAMKAGAVDLLERPYERSALLTAVASALADIRGAADKGRAAELALVRIGEMSGREREVLDGLLAGKSNKQIARDLGISPRTVEMHRAKVMERLGAHSLPEAVLMAAAAGIQPARPIEGADRIAELEGRE